MAGMGKRLRPHTLTQPKPLIPIAGKPIVQRLVEDLAAQSPEPIDKVAFVIGDFGKAVEEDLLKIAKKVGAKGEIFYQKEPLGTAHAILCAAPELEDRVIVAFADTLFKADFKFDMEKDGILWVRQIADPSQFGVVTLDGNGAINSFVEKPKEFVSDLAMIGIYFFKDGAALRSELQRLIDEGIQRGGEYQLPDALSHMTKEGLRFFPGEVDEWLDCGNKNATVSTNSRILDFMKSDEPLISADVKVEDSVIIPPCFIGPGVTLRRSVIGPYVSVGENSTIEDSVIRESIIQEDSFVFGSFFEKSMVGNHVTLISKAREWSIGDYNTVE